MEDDGGTGVWDRSSPAPPRQRPDLGAPDDCDEPSLDKDDWPFDDPSVDVARLRESLKESEADIDSETANGERRSARDRYTARPERA